MSLTCPECSQRCKNLSGLRRHQNSIHRNDPGLSVPVTKLQRTYHPILTGTYTPYPITLFSFFEGRRCNRYGTPVPPHAPPEIPTAKADSDWSPFSSRAAFELAGFVFADAELSQRKINNLLELWAATLVPHKDAPPFANHRELHHQIDSIEVGDVRWESAQLKYEGPLPRTTRIPEWKTTVHEVWFRDPRQVIKNILATTDFDGHIDYAAYREFSDNKRQYCNLMSGNWSWRQSVRARPIHTILPAYRYHCLGCHCSGPFDARLHVRSNHLGVR